MRRCAQSWEEISNTAWGRRAPDILGYALVWFVGGFIEFLGTRAEENIN